MRVNVVKVKKEFQVRIMQIPDHSEAQQIATSLAPMPTIGAIALYRDKTGSSIHATVKGDKRLARDIAASLGRWLH